MIKPDQIAGESQTGRRRNIHRMKPLKIIFIIIGAVLVVTFIAASWFIGSQVSLATTQLVTNEASGTTVTVRQWEKYHFDGESFEREYGVEDFELTSTHDGHTIPVSYLYADPDQADKNCDTVILVHGLGGNRRTSFPIAPIFLENGFNVLTYDQRSSGENTAPHSTFGYLEKFDLIDAIRTVRANAPSKRIGVWGESFGAATIGLALGVNDIDKELDFVILDSPIAEANWLIRESMKQNGMDGILGSYFIACGNIVTKLRLGFGYGDLYVPEAVEHIQTPILIINSKADDVTPYFMGEAIYNVIQNDRKRLFTVNDSKHAEIFLDHPEAYRSEIESLIAEIR